MVSLRRATRIARGLARSREDVVRTRELAAHVDERAVRSKVVAEAAFERARSPNRVLRRRDRARRNSKPSIDIMSAEDEAVAGVPASSMLFAVHKHLQTRCAAKTSAFLACKKQDQDPEKCLKQGAAMTGCLVEVLRDLKATCGDELNGYAGCLDYRSNNFEKCRAEQEAFETKCSLK